jgi:hypothetical protein
VRIAARREALGIAGLSRPRITLTAPGLPYPRSPDIFSAIERRLTN